MFRVLAVILVFGLATASAQDVKFSYVGTNTCKMCHKKAEKGNQFGVWSKTAHSGALEMLSSEAALKIAQEKGLEKPPAESAECLQCHVTGWGQEGGYELLTAEFRDNPENARAVKKNDSKGNVGCESCHGPGSKYKSKKTMAGLTAGTVEAASVGFITPDEATCQKCHNENNPTAGEFDFATMVAKIAHPYP